MNRLIFSSTRVCRGIRVALAAIASALLWYLAGCGGSDVKPAAPALAVTALDPADGQKGTVVEISGVGFGAAPGAVGVAFNGRGAVVTSVTDNKIVTMVPADATTGIVQVSVNGVAVDGPVFTITAPTISIASVKPTSGKAGSEVVIAGVGFGNDVQKIRVSFNGQPASVKSVTPSTIIVVVPSGVNTGKVAVRVANVEIDGPVFTVVDDTPVIRMLTPDSALPGASITISGYGFAYQMTDNTVKFNGAPATITAATPSTITATVPFNATTGEVTVTVNGRSSGGVMFTVMVPVLAITGIQPVSGIIGSTIAISGQGFSLNPADNIVTINGVPAQVVLVTPTQLNAIVGPGTTSGPVQVTVNGAFVTGPVFSVRAQVQVTTLVGNGVPGVLDSPYGITLNLFDDMYVTNQHRNNIVRIDHSRNSVANFAGGGTLQAPADGHAAAASFREPTGITYVGTSGQTDSFLVADAGTNTIRVVFDYSSQWHVLMLAGNTAGIPGYADGRGATATGQGGAEFYNPVSVVFSPNLDATFIVDNMTHVIRVMDRHQNVGTFAGAPFAPGSADGHISACRFLFPTAITADATGNLYVADSGNGKLRKIDVNGMVTTMASNVGQLYGLAVDTNGNVYGCGDHHKIMRFDPQGNATEIAGGARGFADGDGVQARFSNPSGIAITRDGSLIVTDRDNHRVRKITFVN